MTRRLDIVLDEIVLHGGATADVATLERRISEALATRLAQGSGAAGPTAADPADRIAARIAGTLPAGARGGDGK